MDIFEKLQALPLADKMEALNNSNCESVYIVDVFKASDLVIALLESKSPLYIHTVKSHMNGHVSKRITNSESFPSKEFGLNAEGINNFFSWVCVKVK